MYSTSVCVCVCSVRMCEDARMYEDPCTHVRGGHPEVNLTRYSSGVVCFGFRRPSSPIGLCQPAGERQPSPSPSPGLIIKAPHRAFPRRFWDQIQATVLYRRCHLPSPVSALLTS